MIHWPRFDYVLEGVNVNFKPWLNAICFVCIQHPGMGPGRRIYMAMYMGAVVYTCFLCLFAVSSNIFFSLFSYLLVVFWFLLSTLYNLYGYNTMCTLKICCFLVVTGHYIS